MGKEILAIALLAALIILSALSIWYIDSLISSLTEGLDTSQEYAERREYDKAEAVLREVVEVWRGSHKYTKVILRQYDIDSTTNSLYELLGNLHAQDESHLGGYEKVRAHLITLAELEHVSLASIF